MEKRYQIFVSSTYTDLKEERAAVFQTLMQLDCIPAGMELFPAADEEQWKFIKRVINDCDYYLLIIGGRYGSLTQEGISYTEKEYDYAVEHGLKVIALLHKDPKQIAAGKTERSNSALKKLAKFREKVSRGRLVQFWSQPSDLPGLVALSLTMTMKLYPAVGWVRASAVANTEALSDLNELRKRNKTLEAELAKLLAQNKAKDTLFAGRTYEETYRLLKGESVEIHGSLFPDKQDRTTNALIGLIAFSHTLARGVSNEVDSSDGETNLFYGLASRLALYGLTDFMPTPRNESWQRLGLTEAGKRFVAAYRAAHPKKEGDRQAGGQDHSVKSISESSAVAASTTKASEEASRQGEASSAIPSSKADKPQPQSKPRRGATQNSAS